MLLHEGDEDAIQACAAPTNPRQSLGHAVQICLDMQPKSAQA